jgi:hypothetical protein
VKPPRRWLAWLAVIQCAAMLPASSATASTMAGTPRARLDATESFVDTFAGPTPTSPLYGLNQALDTRQTGTVRAAYTRVSGLWNSVLPPPSGFVQVNHPSYPNRLSFLSGTSAVMLDAPVRADPTGRYTVSTVIDPIVGDAASSDWGSLVFSRSRASSGYVTNADVDLGLTLRSNGEVALYSAGTVFWSGRVAASATGYPVSVGVSTGADRAATLTIGGYTVTVPAPSSINRWPSEPHLFLGAYLSNPRSVTTFGSGQPGQGLTVSRLDTSVAASAKPFVDTFDGAADTSATGYGLDDGLRGRQPSVVSSAYTRTSGQPSDNQPPPAWASQVDQPQYPNRLSFWNRPSAVRLNRPVTADLDGSYSVHAVVDPVANGDDRSSAEWVSIMLSGSADAAGYPTRAETDLALTVRSDGRLQLYRKGAPTWSTEPAVAPAPDGTFDVTVASDHGRHVGLVVNGTQFNVTTTADLPRTAYLSLGAYPTNANTVSTVDDLRVSMLAGLGYYGYFGSAHADAPNDGADHTPEVVPYTNMNEYLSGPESGYLDRCRPQSCAIYSGWAQFDPNSSPFRLNPDAAAQLAALKAVVGSNLDKVGAIYLLDEPYGVGRDVSYDDLNTAVAQVRAAFPGRIVMMTMDGPSVIADHRRIPTGIDWVGFDWYCQGHDQIASTLATLESRLESPYQRTYLVPESATGVCPGSSDASIADAQSSYMNIAAGDPRVTYLMNFGWWFSPAYGGDMNPLADLPRTAQVQRGIGESIVGLR